MRISLIGAAMLAMISAVACETETDTSPTSACAKFAECNVFFVDEDGNFNSTVCIEELSTSTASAENAGCLSEFQNMVSCGMSLECSAYAECDGIDGCAGFMIGCSTQYSAFMACTAGTYTNVEPEDICARLAECNAVFINENGTFDGTECYTEFSTAEMDAGHAGCESEYTELVGCGMSISCDKWSECEDLDHCDVFGDSCSGEYLNLMDCLDDSRTDDEPVTACDKFEDCNAIFHDQNGNFDRSACEAEMSATESSAATAGCSETLDATISCGLALNCNTFIGCEDIESCAAFGSACFAQFEAIDMCMETYYQDQGM